MTQMALSRESFTGMYNMGARHLQLVRSIPTKALLSTVVGMKKMEHVRANLEIVGKPVMMRDEFFESLGPIRRKPFIDEEMDI